MTELFVAFTCALQKEVLFHGKLFVSENYVCFYSSVLLKDTKVTCSHTYSKAEAYFTLVRLFLHSKVTTAAALLDFLKLKINFHI